MAIACVYCGGSHEAPAEVRACWSRTEVEADPAVPGGAAPAAISSAPTRRPAAAMSTTTAVPAAEPSSSVVAADVGRGPAVLGRHVVVEPGTPTPSGWDDAERVTIELADLAHPASLLARLRAAWHGGRSLVIEVGADVVGALGGPPEPSSPPAPTSSETSAPFELGPRHEFMVDHLRHLVIANSVDRRDPDRPRWWLLQRAVELGAAVSVDPAACDVVLPDGRGVWLDAGPPRALAPIGDVAVVHAAAVEHGSLEPPRPEAWTDSSSSDPTGLAPDQAAAVTHAQGSARIIAPAGSGKTRVLTERARRLATAWQVPSSAIGLVAFNARAQQEMRERTGDLAGLQVRTLNSIALAIVNGVRPFAPRPSTVRTITEPEVRRILDRLVRVRRVRNTDPMAAWIEALGLVRLGLVPPAEAEARYEGDVDGLTEVWPRYLAELRREGVVDFDGQIHGALEVLLGDPVARATAQRACRHLLVDEFQDLTPAHLLLVRLLAGPGGAVFGVGDDDQTIYGYNGADPAWLIEFAELFPGAESHPLEVNYRCPPDVIDAADHLLRHNRRRVAKRIRAAPGRADDGPGLSVVTSDDPVADTVAHVRRVIEAGADPGQIAVLTRVNVLLAPVQVALTGAGVPVSGSVGPELLDRTAVRAALAWLRLGADERFRADDLGEALRRPSRSLHPRVAEWVAEQRDLDGLRRLAARLTDETAAGRVAAFADDIARLTSLSRARSSTAELIDAVIDDIGLGGAVSRLDDSRRGMNRAAQGDELLALRQLARLCDADPDASDPGGRGVSFERWLRGRLAGAAAAGGAASAEGAPGVVLATVHRVKGQEWPEVVLHLAERTQFPHRLSDDVEEERRVFHVGLTRASRHVALVTGPVPSPFVAELTAEPPEHPPSSEPAARAAATRPTGPSRRPDHPLLDRSTVVVVPGMTLIDQGVEWRIVQTGPDDLLAESAAGSRRRFGYDRPVRTAGRQQGVPRPGADVAGLEPTAALVYDELRRYRDLARDGKPAYTVFDDRTLVAIAEQCPGDSAALGTVRGVGPAKLERHGAPVLAVVAAAVSARAAETTGG